jgi:hypothetical protein
MIHFMNQFDSYYKSLLLIIQTNWNGFVIYSLGPNQKDDGGSGAWGWGIKTGDDIAWKE